MQEVASEVSDNWPGIFYILIMVGFSLRFLYERREETRALRRIAAELQYSLNSRLDHIENLVRTQGSYSAIQEKQRRDRQSDGVAARDGHILALSNSRGAHR